MGPAEAERRRRGAPRAPSGGPAGCPWAVSASARLLRVLVTRLSVAGSAAWVLPGDWIHQKLMEIKSCTWLGFAACAERPGMPARATVGADGARREATRRDETARNPGGWETRVSPSSPCCFLPLDQSREQTTRRGPANAPLREVGTGFRSLVPFVPLPRPSPGRRRRRPSGAGINPQADDHGAGFPLILPPLPPGGGHSEARASRDIHTF